MRKQVVVNITHFKQNTLIMIQNLVQGHLLQDQSELVQHDLRLELSMQVKQKAGPTHLKVVIINDDKILNHFLTIQLISSTKDHNERVTVIQTITNSAKERRIFGFNFGLSGSLQLVVICGVLWTIMTQKALKLRAEVEVHSVSCPGVFFACKGPVHLSICFLGFHVKTKPFPPSFPLLFHDK